MECFVGTHNGWVQSYGSRCVRPPIPFGDVSRLSAITTAWARYAPLTRCRSDKAAEHVNHRRSRSWHKRTLRLAPGEAP